MSWLIGGIAYCVIGLLCVVLIADAESRHDLWLIVVWPLFLAVALIYTLYEAYLRWRRP